MTDKLVQHIVDAPIYTKISVIRKKLDDLPHEKLIERINAVTCELVKLQLQVREYAVLDWYDKLNPRQKAIHDFFEEHSQFFIDKAGTKYNWVVMSDKEFKGTRRVRDVKRFSDDVDMWYGYSKKGEKAPDDFTDEQLEGMLFTPLFSVTK